MITESEACSSTYPDSSPLFGSVILPRIGEWISPVDHHVLYPYATPCRASYARIEARGAAGHNEGRPQPQGKGLNHPILVAGLACSLPFDERGT